MRLANLSFLTGLLLLTANVSANSEEYSTASSPAAVSTHSEECSVTAKRVTVTAIVTETILLPTSSGEICTSKNQGPATSEIISQNLQGQILTIISTQTVAVPGTSQLATKASASEGKILTVVTSVSTEHTTLTLSSSLVSSASCTTPTAQGTGAVLTIVTGTSTIQVGHPLQTMGPAILPKESDSEPSIFPCPGEPLKSCSLMAPDNHTMVVGEPYSTYSEASTSAFASTWAPQNSPITVIADYAHVTQARPRSIIACKSDGNYDTPITDFYYSTTVVYVSSSANPTSVSAYSTLSSQTVAPSTSATSTHASQTSPKPTLFPSSGTISTSPNTTTGADTKSLGSEVLSEGLTSDPFPASDFPRCSPDFNGGCVVITTTAAQTPTLSLAGNSPVIVSTSLGHETQTVPSSSTSITSFQSMSSTSTSKPPRTARPCGPNAGVNCVDPGEPHPTLPNQPSDTDSSSTSLSAPTHSETSTPTAYSRSEPSTSSATPTATSGSSQNLPIPRWLLMLCFLGAVLAASPAPISSAPSPSASKPPISSTAILVSPLDPASATSVVPISAPIHGDAEMKANMHVWAMLLEAAHVTPASRSHPQTTGITSSPISSSSTALPVAIMSPTTGSSSSKVSSSLVPKITTSSTVAKRDPPLSFSMTFQQPSPTPCAGNPEWMCVPMSGDSTYSWNPATLGHPPVVATTSARSPSAATTSQPTNETVTLVQTILSTVTASSTPLANNTQSTSAKIFKVPFLLVLLCLAGSVFAITEPQPAFQLDSMPQTRTNVSERTLVNYSARDDELSPIAGYVLDPAEKRKRKILIWAILLAFLIPVSFVIIKVSINSRAKPPETATQTSEGSLLNTTGSLLYRSTSVAAAAAQQSSSSEHLIVPVLFMALCFAGSVFALSAAAPKSASILTAPRFVGSRFDTTPPDPPAPVALAGLPKEPVDTPETWTIEQSTRDRRAMDQWLEKKRRADTLRSQIFTTLAGLLLCLSCYVIYKTSKHGSPTGYTTTQVPSLVGAAKTFLSRFAPGAIVRANSSQTSSASNFKVPFLLMFFCLALPAFVLGQPQSAFRYDQGAPKEYSLGTRTVLASPVAGGTTIEIPVAGLAQETPEDDAKQVRQQETDTFGNAVLAIEDEPSHKKNKGYYVFLVAFYVFLLGFIVAIAVTCVVVLQHRHDPTYRRDLPARAQPTAVSGTAQGRRNYAHSSESSSIRNIPVLLLLACLLGSAMAVTPALGLDISITNPQLNDFRSYGSSKMSHHSLEDVPLNDMGSSSHASGQPVFERGTALSLLPPAYEYPVQVSQTKKPVWYKRRKNICILVVVGIILGLCILLSAAFLLRLGGSNGNNTNTNIVQNPVVSFPAPVVTLVVTSAISSLRPDIFPTFPRSPYRSPYTTQTVSLSTIPEVSSVSTTTRAPNPGPNLTGGAAIVSPTQSIPLLTSTGSPVGMTSAVPSLEISSTSRASDTGPIITGGAMSLTPTGVGVSDQLQHIGGGLVNMQAKNGPVKARENSSEPIIIGGAKEGGMSDATSSSSRSFRVPSWYGFLLLARSTTAQRNLSTPINVGGAKEGGMSYATSGSTRNFKLPSWYSPLLLARFIFGKPQDSLSTSFPTPVAVVYQTSIVTAPPVTATTIETIFSGLGDDDSSTSVSASTTLLAATMSSYSGDGVPAASIQGQLATAGPTAVLQENLGFALGYGMQRPLVLLTLCVVVCVVLPLGLWSSGKAKYAKRKTGAREKRKAKVEGLVRKQRRGPGEEDGIQEALNPVGEIKDSLKARLRSRQLRNLKEDENGWIIV